MMTVPAVKKYDFESGPAYLHWTAREMVAGDLYPTRAGFGFVCELPGPGPWHACRVGDALVSVSPNWRQMAVVRDGVMTWIDPVAEIQA